MAQLNITLNQEEILQLLSTDHDQAFRELLKSSLNSILMGTFRGANRQPKRNPRTRSQDPDREDHPHSSETSERSFQDARI